ncbi:MAG: hypothetical protein KDI68_08935 [Gammaproteobacteria bacterium]|nr:hypothetical protein [Gammaproteobacteria bacterium]
MGLPADSEEQLGTEPQEPTRLEMGRAGLQAFFAITAEWSLSAEQQRLLLGNPGRSRFYLFKAGKAASLSDDELDRLAYVSGIYATLNILYSPANCLRWLNNPGSGEMIWGRGSPMEYLLSGGIVAMADIHRYLNGLRGGA